MSPRIDRPCKAAVFRSEELQFWRSRRDLLQQSGVALSCSALSPFPLTFVAGIAVQRVHAAGPAHLPLKGPQGSRLLPHLLLAGIAVQ